MQSFFEFVLGLFVILAAAILAQFGLDLDRHGSDRPEIHRTQDCREAPGQAMSTANQDC